MADSMSLKAILSADGSQMSSTFNQIAGQVGGLQKTLMGGIGFGIMSSIGGKAVDLVSNGVKAMASTVMDSGMSFEAAGSQIAATMGKSKGEITEIINEASRLGATTSFTATQAAEGFNVLAMSGLDAQEQIAAMAPILDLAAAGSYSLDSAASQVVGTVKGFGDSFDNAQKYADMFAKGATLASTDVSSLGVAMSDSAALAASYGQEADRTCIALLRLAEQNVTGSEAATAMSRAMADLYTPTDAAAGKLKELGVNVYDSQGKARDFNTVVDELNTAMSDMTDEERKAAEATIFTSYGMKAFDKMCVSSTEKVREFEEGLRSATGSAAAQASEQLNNLKGDVTIFGSAMEGLGVTIFNKLSPSFRGIVQSATDMISGINASLENGKIGAFVTNASKYFGIFMRYAKQVGSSFGQAFSAVGQALGKLNGNFGSLTSLNSFADVCSAVSNALISLAGFIEAHAGTIAKLITLLPKVAAAFMGLRVAGFVVGLVSTIGGAFMKLSTSIASGIGNKLASTASGMSEAGSAAIQTTGPMLAAAKSFMMIGAGLLLTAGAFALLAQSAIALASAGAPAIAVMAGLVVGVAALSLGMMALVTHAAATAAQMSAAGTAFLMIGAAVLLVAAGFAVMAAAAIALTNAGTPAIAMFAAMVVVMALLAAGAALLAPALTAGAVGLIAFGAAVLLVSVGALLAAAAIAVISSTLPTMAAYGMDAAAASAALGAALIVLGAGALVAGAGAVVLGAGLIAAGAGALVAAAGVTALGAAVLVLGAGVLVCAAGVMAMGAALTMIGANATTVTAGFMALTAGVAALSAGILALTAALVAFTAGLIAAAAGLVAGMAAFVAFAAAVTASAGGMTLLAASTALVLASVAGIASQASSAASSLSQMESSISVVESGMNALQSTVSSVMSSVTSAVRSASTDVVSATRTGTDQANAAITSGGARAVATVTATTSKIVATTNRGANQANAGISSGCARAIATITATVSMIISIMNRGAAQAAVAGQQTGQGYASGIASAQGAATAAAAALVASATGAMQGGYGSAYSAGSYIGQGLAAGLRSQQGAVAAAAAALAAAADAAIRAKAQIGSPSKVQIKNGAWTGEGYAIGLGKAAGMVRRQSERIAAIPSRLLEAARIDTGAFAGDVHLDENLSYSRDQTIIVKTYIDKREIGRAAAETSDGIRRTENRRRGVRS